MSAAKTTATRVLFVDDETAFLEIVRPLFVELSGGNWDIHTATDATLALQILRDSQFDLAVLDLRMPGMDGMQLLQTLNQEQPALQKVFLTGFSDQATRLAGLAGGAALFLEKPTTADGLRGVFTTLNELVAWQQKRGERGALRQATLLDLIKLECKGGNSRLFEVFNRGVSGQIWIKEGVIIHAVTEDRRGQSAFTFLATLENAEFNLKQFAEPVERSIDRQWEFLVLEAVRLQEHSSQASPAPEPARVSTQPPPAAPGPGIRSPEPTEPSRVPRRSAPRAKTVPAALTPSAVPAPVSAPLAALLPSLETGAAELLIEEILYCTTKHEVLYEDRCRKTDRRLGFAEFVARNARQLGERLPLGEIDRLELQSACRRIVARMQGDRCLLVGTNTSMPLPVAGLNTTLPSVEVWMHDLPVVRGVLAVGLIQATRPPLTRTFSPDFAPQVLEPVWQAVLEACEAARQQELPAWLLRWIFERAQLYVLRRTDAFVLAAFIRKEAEAVDLAGLERLFREFTQFGPPH